MIIIDNMEMPKRCWNCRFAIEEDINDYGCHVKCAAIKHGKYEWKHEGYTSGRPDWCPLIEITDPVMSQLRGVVNRNEI